MRAYDNPAVMDDRTVYDGAAVLRAIAQDVIEGTPIPKRLYYFLMGEALIHESTLMQLREAGVLPTPNDKVTAPTVPNPQR